jgi:hypothetical protein
MSMANETLKVVDSVVTELESIQAQIGRIQVSLLTILTNQEVDQWDDAAQDAMIKLESVQRMIGETQVDLVRQMPTPDGLKAGIETLPGPAVAEEPAEGRAGAGIAIREWLTDKGIELLGAKALSGLDAAADRAALYLGDNFNELDGFYEAIKLNIHGRHNKWHKLEDKPPEMINKVIQFGSMLHGCSFLSEFKYIRSKKSAVFVPLSDGRVQNFFTGGWLERYVLHNVSEIYQTTYGRPLTSDLILHGGTARLPDGRNTEFDLLFSLPDQRVIWLECKTGKWQNYTARFKEINQNFMQLPPEQAALVLLDAIDAANKASATELTGMTVMGLQEMKEWLLGVMK